MSNKKNLWIAVGVVFAFFLVVWNHYKERNSFECSLCHSSKDEFRWKVGMWMGPSIPISSKTSSIRSSAIYKDFFDDSHQHDWVFRQGSPYYAFGSTWGGCAIGVGASQNEFKFLYELDRDYREFITEKVGGGELSMKEVMGLLALPAKNEEKNGAENEEELALRELIEVLEEEYESKW